MSVREPAIDDTWYGRGLVTQAGSLLSRVVFVLTANGANGTRDQLEGTVGVIDGEREWLLGSELTLIPQEGGLVSFEVLEGSAARAVYKIRGYHVDR